MHLRQVVVLAGTTLVWLRTQQTSESIKELESQCGEIHHHVNLL